MKKTTLRKARGEIWKNIAEIINRPDLTDKTKRDFLYGLKWDIWKVENDNFLKR